MNHSKPATSPDKSAQHADRHEDEGRTDETAVAGDDAVQRAIGSQLRAVYDEVIRLPVPDRFLSLLSSLDRPSAGSGDAGRDHDN